MIKYIKKIFGPKKPKRRQYTMSELVEIYTFHNERQTEALNAIVSFRFGREYDLPPVTIEQQIQGLRTHLIYRRNQAIKNERYEEAAKLRDDMLKIDYLLEDIYTTYNSKVK